MTRAQMDEIGMAWVGPNARPMINRESEHIGWYSSDKLKGYRFPQEKGQGFFTGKTRGNLTEAIILENGKMQPIRNAHIDLIP